MYRSDRNYLLMAFTCTILDVSGGPCYEWKNTAIKWTKYTSATEKLIQFFLPDLKRWSGGTRRQNLIHALHFERLTKNNFLAHYLPWSLLLEVTSKPRTFLAFVPVFCERNIIWLWMFSFLCFCLRKTLFLF